MITGQMALKKILNTHPRLRNTQDAHVHTTMVLPRMQITRDGRISVDCAIRACIVMQVYRHKSYNSIRSVQTADGASEKATSIGASCVITTVPQV